MTIAELYEAWEKKLHRYATRLVRDSHRAEDLVQETFIRAMGHLLLLEQLNDHQREAWLCRVLKNLFYDEQRARQREEMLAEKITRQVQGDLIESHPLLAVVWQDLFDRIPERYRELLYKRYVLNMNSEEIASELGVPAATVRSRLHQAMKWLRANRTRFL
jgi:RNA polymerase sigma-70 factor (ECF subfamily)